MTLQSRKSETCSCFFFLSGEPTASPLRFGWRTRARCQTRLVATCMENITLFIQVKRRNSAGVIMAGLSIPDSRKSLSPVSKTSAFALIAARSMGLSFTSLISASSVNSLSGTDTNSRVNNAIDRNLSRLMSRWGNFLLTQTSHIKNSL